MLVQYKAHNTYGLIVPFEIHFINPLPDAVKSATRKKEDSQCNEDPFFHDAFHKRTVTSICPWNGGINNTLRGFGKQGGFFIKAISSNIIHHKRIINVCCLYCSCVVLWTRDSDTRPDSEFLYDRVAII